MSARVGSTMHQFVDQGVMPDAPVRVAAIVGDDVGLVSGSDTSVRTVLALWGEIASQLEDR